MVDRDESDYLPHELVDAFFMDIERSLVAAGGGMTEVISLPGLYMIANIGLSFEVECLPGFAGESCVPVCSTDPCSNKGTCLQSVGGFTCSCRGDFTGETCETRINDCQDVDCSNGTCVDGVQSFTCQCDPGFTGESCVPVCSTDPCSNNGTCLQSVSGFTCACRGDFTGETCETRINDCQDVDCNNGTCVDGITTDASISIGLVAGAVSLGAVLLLAVLLGVCILGVCIFCNRNKLFATGLRGMLFSLKSMIIISCPACFRATPVQSG